MGFFCEKCGKSFKSRFNLGRHKVSKTACSRNQTREQVGGAINENTCEICSKVFSNKRNLTFHKQLYHSNVKKLYPCGLCKKFFSGIIELDNHRNSEHKISNDFYVKSTAFRGTCQVFRLDIPDDQQVINSALEFAYPHVLELIKRRRADLNVIRCCFILGIEFEKDYKNSLFDINRDEHRLFMNFRSKNEKILFSSNYEEVISEMLFNLEKNATNFQTNGSDWSVHRIIYLDVSIGKCLDLTGYCGLHVLKNPRENGSNIQEREVVIDKLRNDEEEEEENSHGKCFYFALASYFLPEAKSISELETFINEQFIQNLEIPVRVSQIKKFEEQNKHLSIKVNVIFKNEYEEIFPVYISKILAPAHHTVNLLLYYTEWTMDKPETYPSSVKNNIEVSDDSEEEKEDGEETLSGEIHRKRKIKNFPRSYFDSKEIKIQNGDKFRVKKKWNKIPRYFDSELCIPHYALIENLEKVVANARMSEIRQRAKDLFKKKKRRIDLISDQIEDLIESGEKDEDEISLLKAEKRELWNQIKETTKHRNQVISTGYSQFRRICYNCLNIFSTKDALLNHSSWCFKESPSFPIIPAPGEVEQFEQRRKHVLTPVQMFFDFEAYQVDVKKKCTCENEKKCHHKTTTVKEQEPLGYCLIVTENENKVLEVLDYIGPNAAEKFLDDLLEMEVKYSEYRRIVKPMQISKEEEKSFRESTHCYICKEAFHLEDKKTRDHDHHGEGKYLGNFFFKKVVYISDSFKSIFRCCTQHL